MTSNIIAKEFDDALENYDREAMKILATFAKSLEAKEVPETIYHYTDDKGLKGILESGKIWVTDIFDLNDPSELLHGLSHAMDILKSKQIESLPDTKRFATHFSHFRPFVREIAHFFVVSFSSDGDELGQWRAYADDGRGFALGFDARSLEAAFAQVDDPQHQVNASFPTSYDDETLIELHKQLTEKMFDLISLPSRNNADRATTNSCLEKLSVHHAAHVIRTTGFFKHRAYKNEKEYRFLQVFPSNRAAPDVKYRMRPYSLVRYREFDWRSVARSSLKEIVVGPAADQGLEFADDCLKAFHPTDEVLKIYRSKIPYRSR